jgi:hypothetical protein
LDIGIYTSVSDAKVSSSPDALDTPLTDDLDFFTMIFPP